MKTKLITLLLLLIPIIAWAEPSPTPSGDENLKNALAETVKSVTSTLNDVKAQTPEFFQQYIAREIYYNNLWSIGGGAISLLFLIAGFIGVFICVTGKRERGDGTITFWLFLIATVFAAGGPMRL